jgi:hypothetical protein
MLVGVSEGNITQGTRFIERMGVTVVRFPAWRCLLEPDVVAREVRRLAD